MKKIKIPKRLKQDQVRKAQERRKKAQLDKIIKRYDVLVEQTIDLYHDKTMGELWAALDVLKDQMRKELKAIGIK